MCFGYEKTISLKDVLYVPGFMQNLISVSQLLRDGYSINFHADVQISRNGKFICSGSAYSNLYYIHPISNQVNNTEAEQSSKKRKCSSNDSYLWHLRLGHINPNRIQRLIQDGPLGSLRLEEWSPCESCLMGKMTKRPFTHKAERAKEILNLIHTDVCGPMTTPARGGYEYFITFTDDNSRYGYVYLMRRKSDSFEKFKECKAEVERQTGKLIKALRSDRGGEYLLGEFKDYLVHQGIVSQLTAPGTPQQNGVAERRNRTLLEMVRSMMSHASLPISFWGYALETAAYILNLAFKISTQDAI